MAPAKTTSRSKAPAKQAAAEQAAPKAAASQPQGPTAQQRNEAAEKLAMRIRRAASTPAVFFTAQNLTEIIRKDTGEFCGYKLRAAIDVGVNFAANPREDAPIWENINLRWIDLVFYDNGDDLAPNPMAQKIAALAKEQAEAAVRLNKGAPFQVVFKYEYSASPKQVHWQPVYETDETTRKVKIGTDGNPVVRTDENGAPLAQRKFRYSPDFRVIDMDVIWKPELPAGETNSAAEEMFAADQDVPF